MQSIDNNPVIRRNSISQGNFFQIRDDFKFKNIYLF